MNPIMRQLKSIGGSLEYLFSRLTLISGYLSGWVIFALMVLVTVGVTARRVFGHALIFGDEYSAYMMVFCVFMGGAYTLQQDAHIRVDVLAIRLNERLRISLRFITSCLSLIYGAVLTWKAGWLVLYYKDIGHEALSVLETPTWIPAAAMPIGLAFLSIQMVVCIVEDLRFLLKANSIGNERNLTY